MERILIVRLGAMGDVVHALPAVAALRAALPGVQIGWVVEERWAELLAAPSAREGPAGTPQKPLVDLVHTVDTRLWRAAPLAREVWSEVRAAREGLKAAGYDTAIDLQGLVKSGVFARLSGAPIRVGFARPKERLAAMLYTRTIETRAVHVIDQNLELVGALVGNLRPATSDLLPRDASAESWCTAKLRRHSLNDFVLMSPGAGWGAKIWPSERYAEVALALAGAGIPVVVNFAIGEAELAGKMIKATGGKVYAIHCSVGELVALTRRARVFIGGDSGPMHLAAALGVPVVAVFGPTDPARNGPYGTRNVVLRSPQSRTSYAHVADSDQAMLDITSAEVIAAARELLETPHA